MKRSQKNKSPIGLGKSMAVNSLCGALLGIASFFAMLLLFCAMGMALPDPHPFILPLCFFSVYSASFLCGLFAVKKNGGKDALLCGLLSGASFIILLWAIVFLINSFSSSATLQAPNFIWKLLSIPITMLGAFAGLKNTGKKPRKKARKN